MNSMQKLYEENKKLKQRLDWYDYFVDYVMQYDNNVYNSACEYADLMEQPIKDEQDE